MNFSSKRTGETEIFTIDFANLLMDGELITSASFAVQVVSGIDANSSSMLNSLAAILGSKVSVMITGGLAGVSYVPLCTVVTNFGQTLILPNVGEGIFCVE